MDFVIVSTADWDNPFWTNKQHVAATLAKMGHRVLYIDSLGLRAPTMTKSDVGRIKRRLVKLFVGIKNVRENIWVMSPFSIPMQRYGLIRILNKYVLTWMIRRYIKKLGFHDLVLWTYNPLTSYLVGQLGEIKSVYHCVDDISAQPGMPKDLIQQEEIRLLEKVDVVFTTAITLNEEKRKYNSNCYYFPNVADYDHFHKAVTEHYARPSDMPNDGKPVLGFIGAISGYKLDFKLLAYVAEKCPEYHIVLIGKVGEGDPYTDITLLKKHSNIHFLGPKAYVDLPRYLEFFDVALLPCCINEYTNGMFPMKFFEYLAAGRNIVSTNLLSIAKYGDICKLSVDYGCFVDNINKLLVDDSAINIRDIDDIAKNNTYLIRMGKMMERVVGLNEK